MTIKLYVKSRLQIEGPNTITNPHIIISIRSPGDSVPDVIQNEHTVDVKYFCFPDLDTAPSLSTIMAFPELKGCELFNDTMAMEMASFVDKHIQNKIYDIVVHCFAGHSRSAGAAAAIAKHYNGNDDEFFGGTTGLYGASPYSPNMRVYSKLLMTLQYLNE